NPNAVAFAVAGGYIYVSRTMLGLANSEAEIAAVLAHEMAHVIERHSVRRAEMENAQRQAKTFPDAAAFQILAREQEIEADILGVKIIAAAGYDPMAQARFLQTIGEFSQLSNQVGLIEGRSNDPESHPTIAIRIAAASEAAAEAEISIQPWGAEGQTLGYDAAPLAVPGTGMVRRATFLAAIDNIIYGPRPSEGLALGTTYVDATSKFTFELPPGFSFKKTGRAVLALGPEGASLRFDLQHRWWRSGSDMAQYMRYGAGRGLRFDTIEATEIGGMEAAVGIMEIPAAVPSHIYFVAVRFTQRTIFRFQFTVPDSFSESMVERIAASPASLRMLTDREAQTWNPVRLEVVTVTADTTMEALAARMRLVDQPVDWLMALNGLAPRARLQPGQRIKILAQ
ncbi:MAG: M48 family metalloprotease, partial [Alphaproteobacteria bacterium]|nr:M48 family metalloprotease [Alphaproteobacteria bacterium]